MVPMGRLFAGYLQAICKIFAAIWTCFMTILVFVMLISGPDLDLIQIRSGSGLDPDPIQIWIRSGSDPDPI